MMPLLSQLIPSWSHLHVTHHGIFGRGTGPAIDVLVNAASSAKALIRMSLVEFKEDLEMRLRS